MAHDQDIPLVDDEIVRLPEDIRHDLATRCASDLYIFAKHVMGYKDMTKQCHRPLCVYLDQHPARFKLTLMPRGHFKTSVCTIARVTQKIVIDPNHRILLLNETSSNAEAFLGAIKENFESNKILRALYSRVIPKDFRKTTWNNQELKLVRDWRGPQGTVEAKGMTSTLTSNHYTHIAVDDPISEEATKSALVMQDANSRIDKVISLMVKPEEDSFDLTGTRWALFDTYSVFMKKYGDKMARFVRAAIKDGQPIFPELISLETLAQARENMGEYMFSCLYMNNPRDVANQDFNIQDLRFWKWSTDEQSVVLYNQDGSIGDEWPLEKLDINTSVDLALSEKITSDRNAIVTTGCTPKGDVIVLEVWAKRCTPLDVVNHLVEVKRRFNPRQTGIESIMYQKSLKHFLKAELERQGLYMNIIDLKAIPSKRSTGNNTKEARIRGLQPIAATGHLYILPTQHELRNELADFPLGEHDDCIDALAHQLTMWRGLVGPQRMAKYNESEQRLFQRIAVGYTPGPEYEAPTHPCDVPHPDDLGIEVPAFSDWQEVVMH